MQFIRGTCTDKIWSSSLCPGRLCSGNAQAAVNGSGHAMRQINRANTAAQQRAGCCTNKSFARFNLDEPTVTAIAGVLPSTTANVASTLTSASPSLTTTATSETIISHTSHIK
ncbi:hypothetical protein BDV29DRAFT_185398 [Aspergillus leporis]|uniref:Uncharacterized protein n=1 Tax=Aspergillus leporis TaxID=41062 RepID=A0A5N5WHK3_9EURO|nr:hypothetical protein BDV29DRAFT_185398 [Aspergillus leporis]